SLPNTCHVLLKLLVELLFGHSALATASLTFTTTLTTTTTSVVSTSTTTTRLLNALGLGDGTDVPPGSPRTFDVGPQRHLVPLMVVSRLRFLDGDGVAVDVRTPQSGGGIDLEWIAIGNDCRGWVLGLLQGDCDTVKARTQAILGVEVIDHLDGTLACSIDHQGVRLGTSTSHLAALAVTVADVVVVVDWHVEWDGGRRHDTRAEASKGGVGKLIDLDHVRRFEMRLVREVPVLNIFHCRRSSCMNIELCVVRVPSAVDDGYAKSRSLREKVTDKVDMHQHAEADAVRRYINWVA
ncbi:hypothetical protein GGR57DRAFT_517900, partial [Xylariaceae sp. FL1272]